MAEHSVKAGSTRHHRVSEEFCKLLDSDFGLRPFHSRAMVGIPVRQALSLCFWAESKFSDGDERGEMLVAYCRKYGIGRYDRRLIDAPELTYEQTAHERRVREES